MKAESSRRLYLMRLFDKIKAICEPLGFTSDMKAYRKNPENYKGSVATVSGVIRVAITKKQMSPDLYELCKLLGKNTVLERINKVIIHIFY